jgi:hypothetical protein
MELVHGDFMIAWRLHDFMEISNDFIEISYGFHGDFRDK